MKQLLLITLLAFCICGQVICQEATIIKLLPADTTGGKPLMQTLQNRKSQRDFSNETLSDQNLSNLLWAANGVNRPQEGKRTAPTAMNDQEIDVYVATEAGTFLYDALKHELVQIGSEDVRDKMGIQGYVKNAPVVLVYVADYKKMSKFMSKEDKDFYAATDVGYVSQNVYLYCASENMATVVIGMLNREKIAEILKLRPEQKVLLSQCVGYPNVK